MDTLSTINAIDCFLNSRDRHSFQKVYHYYYQRLCYFAYGYVDDHHQAEDIVQDVFSHIWEQPPQLEDASKLKGYLYAMVRNRCLNLKRSEGHLAKYQEHELNTENWENDESLKVIKAEVYDEIMASIDKLPPKAKEVFKLGALTQLRESEIAERLGITVNSVKTHKKRARALLKEDLKHLFGLLIIFHL
ncbi:RNA polymerase sigma-70 factor [Carboxylicivirga sp. A043]|uniref:RNA polymerase sigma-70 factor n=1 Tax=Carboxylicivirga litoralis TaxID=2816963 RepID=UPI0021CB7855|nr:RNA polymerase sigma-70 factor [Carboxylicivirga sp. A043]MCU4156328.1 RNA polymerase sigma-70 factor [Carboxylicivirga sp. A043]